MTTQLGFGDELGRDDVIELIVLAPTGDILDRIPCHLGDRRQRRDVCSLHEAILWAHVTLKGWERLTVDLV